MSYLIGNYVRIMSAMLNAFHPTRIKETTDVELIAQHMLALVVESCSIEIYPKGPQVPCPGE